MILAETSRIPTVGVLVLAGIMTLVGLTVFAMGDFRDNVAAAFRYDRGPAFGVGTCAVAGAALGAYVSANRGLGLIVGAGSAAIFALLIISSANDG